MIERNSMNNKTGARRGRVKWLTAGFFSFENHSKGNLPNSRSMNSIPRELSMLPARSQNPKSTFHFARMTKCGVMKWIGENFFQIGKICQKSNVEFCNLLLRNKNHVNLSPFLVGTKYKAKFGGEIRQQSLRFSFFSTAGALEVVTV